MARYGIWKPYLLRGHSVLAFRRGGYVAVAHHQMRAPVRGQPVTLKIFRGGSGDFYETERSFAEWQRDGDKKPRGAYWRYS